MNTLSQQTTYIYRKEGRGGDSGDFYYSRVKQLNSTDYPFNFFDNTSRQYKLTIQVAEQINLRNILVYCSSNPSSN